MRVAAGRVGALGGVVAVRIGHRGPRLGDRLFPRHRLEPLLVVDMKPVVRESDRLDSRCRACGWILVAQDVQDTAPPLMVGLWRSRRGHGWLFVGHMAPGFDRLVMPQVGGRV